jgi:hypothetical protein
MSTARYTGSAAANLPGSLGSYLLDPANRLKRANADNKSKRDEIARLKAELQDKTRKNALLERRLRCKTAELAQVMKTARSTEADNPERSTARCRSHRPAKRRGDSAKHAAPRLQVFCPGLPSFNTFEREGAVAAVVDPTSGDESDHDSKVSLNSDTYLV